MLRSPTTARTKITFPVTTVSSDSTDSKDDPANNLADEFQSKAKLEDSDFADFYKQEMTDPRRRKAWLVSHCQLRETAQVRHMLHQYEKDSLYNDRDRYGEDGMSLVAIEGHVCINGVIAQSWCWSLEREC